MGLQIDSFRLPFYLLFGGTERIIIGMKSPSHTGAHWEIEAIVELCGSERSLWFADQLLNARAFWPTIQRAPQSKSFQCPPTICLIVLATFFFNANQFGNSLNCWPTTVCLVKWFIRSQSILYTDAAYNENPFEWSGFSIKKEFLDLFGTCVSFQKPLLFT